MFLNIKNVLKSSVKCSRTYCENKICSLPPNLSKIRVKQNLCVLFEGAPSKLQWWSIYRKKTVKKLSSATDVKYQENLSLLASASASEVEKRIK